MHLQPAHLSTENPPSSASFNEALSSTNTTTTRSQQAGDFPSQPQRQPQQSARTPVVRHEVSDLFQNLLNTFSSRSSNQLQEVGNEGGGLARPTPMAGKSSSPSGVGRGLPVHTVGGRIDARKEGTEERNTKYVTSSSSYSISTPLIKNSNQKRKKVSRTIPVQNVSLFGSIFSLFQSPARGPEVRNVGISTTSISYVSTSIHFRIRFSTSICRHGNSVRLNLRVLSMGLQISLEETRKRALLPKHRASAKPEHYRHRTWVLQATMSRYRKPIPTRQPATSSSSRNSPERGSGMLSSTSRKAF